MQKKLNIKFYFMRLSVPIVFLIQDWLDLWSTVQLILKTKHYEKFSFTLVCW